MKALQKVSNVKALVSKSACGFAANKIMTMREGLRTALFEEFERDEKTFLWGEECAGFDGAYKVTKGLRDKFGKRRVMDSPITEYGFAQIACGAAFMGLKPICEFMTWNFALQAMDSIINSAAKTYYMSGGQLKCPVTFRGNNGVATYNGCTHSQCLAAYMGHIPGLITVSIYDTEDARALLKYAIREENPTAVLESEVALSYEHEIKEEALGKDFVAEFGKCKIQKEGKDITLISHNKAMHRTMEAAKELEKQGISAEVVNLRFIKPLDRKGIVESVKKTGHALSVEEGWPQHGIGSEIAALLMESSAYDKLKKPFQRLCHQDTPTPYSFDLQDNAVPTVKNIVDVAKRVLGK